MIPSQGGAVPNDKRLIAIDLQQITLETSMRISPLNLSLILLCCYVASADPVIPENMVPKLAKVTPEMIAKITEACPEKPVVKPEKPRKVLIFSRCEGFTHDSISVAEKAFAILGEKTGAFSAVISYDYADFDAARLASYDAIIMNNSTRIMIPQGAPRQAFLDFVRNGKGIVLLHAAVDCFNDFPEAKAMVGAFGQGHPWGGRYAGTDWRFKVDEPTNPITASLPAAGFSMQEEQYQHQEQHINRKKVRVLVSMDMSDPVTSKDKDGKPRGFQRSDGDNPVVWVKTEGKGRVFVNGFGHETDIFWNPMLLKLALAGIQYAIGDL
jgi:type 1 glutamine amidotransferase